MPLIVCQTSFLNCTVKEKFYFLPTSMCLLWENSTLSVNNQCDVVVYGLSGSRSPRGVSPVEESTIIPHMAMQRINYKIFTDKRIKACDVFCDLQYRDSLIPSSSAHKPDMQRDTHVSIDLEGCNDCKKKGLSRFDILPDADYDTLTLYSDTF